MENPPPVKTTFFRTILRIEELPKPAIVAITFGIFGAVAFIDHITGYEISCTVFYLFAIGIATWCIGPILGIVISILSAICTSVINLLSGQQYSNHFAAVWNAAIILAFYFIVVWLLRSLRFIQNTLEARVRERTAVLSAELAERKRLENEILGITEREQRRIGRDIHDSLCQHLTATALAEQFLVEKLQARSAPEVADADRVVGLIEEAIRMARGFAAGLSPLEIQDDGLPSALADLASQIKTRFKVTCRFGSGEAVPLQDAEVSTHLYRIAQEAAHNAIRHGKARNIDIRLEKTGSLITLSVRDDGSGFPAHIPAAHGMGLRNMKYRASMIHGTLTLLPAEPGTLVTCAFHDRNGLVS